MCKLEAEAYGEVKSLAWAQSHKKMSGLQPVLSDPRSMLFTSPPKAHFQRGGVCIGKTWRKAYAHYHTLVPCWVCFLPMGPRIGQGQDTSSSNILVSGFVASTSRLSSVTACCWHVGYIMVRGHRSVFLSFKSWCQRCDPFIALCLQKS